MSSSSSMRRMHSTSSSSSKSNRGGRSVARVLRYPDGRVRRILYPDVKQNGKSSSSSMQQVEKKESAGVNAMQKTEAASGKVNEVEERRRRRRRSGKRVDEGVPDTAGALLALLRSPEARRKRVEEEDAIRSVFDVCDVMPERLMDARVAVLADADVGDVLCYEVLTDDERSNVLPSAMLESKVQRFEVRQGLLVFANERDAEIFASTSLPSSGMDNARKPNLVACEADAIDIFLLASSARAVCVVINEGAQPDPAMLKQVLRGRDASPEELF